jgi:NitT/TauT family transport system substrate-binding protein
MHGRRITRGRRRPAAALVLVALLLACAPPAPAAAPGGGPPAPEPLGLRVGLASSPAPALPNSVLWLAQDLGYYQREGLAVELVELSGSPTVMAALLSGSVDVGNVSTEDVLRVVSEQGADVRALHSPDPRQYFLIAGRADLAGPAALAGAAFGIARLGSLDDTMSRLVLRAHGVDPAGLRYVSLGDPSARAQALVAGRIDAATMSVGTWIGIRHQPGLAVLVSADDYYRAAPLVAKVDAATPAALARKAEAVRRFTAAILKASRAFAADRDGWVEAMLARRPDLERGALEELWPDFRSTWAVNGQLDLAEYARSADFLYASEGFRDVTTHVGVDRWTDTAVLDRVLAEIGVDPSSDPPGRGAP